MWELDHKESWASKNWCIWTVVCWGLLTVPWIAEVKPVHPKGNQSWIFTGRTDAEAEAPILWLPDVKSWLTGKDPDAGKDWGQEETGVAEDEMVGWHHWLNGHEFEQTPEVGDGQGGLACCSPWGRKESDMTEWLNWTELRDFPGPVVENLPYNALDSGSIPGWGNKIPHARGPLRLCPTNREFVGCNQDPACCNCI